MPAPPSQNEPHFARRSYLKNKSKDKTMTTTPIAPNVKRVLHGTTMDDGIQRVTKALAAHGFGILTRIDMHLKMKEKLGKDMPPTVILGACNPAMAFAAYELSTDMTSLIPCNCVVRELSKDDLSIEFSLASAKMALLGDSHMCELAKQADEILTKALEAV